MYELRRNLLQLFCNSPTDCVRKRYYLWLSRNYLIAINGGYNPIALKRIVFYTEDCIVTVIHIRFIAVALVRSLVHIHKCVFHLNETEHFFKGFIPPPFILAFFREVFRPAGVTLHCLVVLAPVTIVRHFSFGVFYFTVTVN